MDSRGYYRTPTIAGETIVFVCEDDLWSVDARGGLARRLTAGPAPVSLPRLSPDGSTIAYVGNDEGTPEVYTIPAVGGPPRRLTFLGSSALYVSGWSRDGGEIYFTSDAGVPFVKETLAFAVGRDGGEPRRLPVGHAMSLDVAAGGATLIGRNNIDPARWKRYRGGTAGHLWVDATGGGTFVRLGAQLNGNLVWPMWHGERVVFLGESRRIRHADQHLPVCSQQASQTLENRTQVADVFEDAGKDQVVERFLGKGAFIDAAGDHVDIVKPACDRGAGRRGVESQYVGVAFLLQQCKQLACCAADVEDPCAKCRASLEHDGCQPLEAAQVVLRLLASLVLVFVLRHLPIVPVEDGLVRQVVRVSEPACTTNDHVVTVQKAPPGNGGKVLTK